MSYIYNILVNLEEIPYEIFDWNYNKMYEINKTPLFKLKSLDDLYNYDLGSFQSEIGVLIYGHKHIPSVNRINNMIYICIGSISVPRFGEKTYCIYENNSFTIFDIDGNIIDYVEVNNEEK